MSLLRSSRYNGGSLRLVEAKITPKKAAKLSNQCNELTTWVKTPVTPLSKTPSRQQRQKSHPPQYQHPQPTTDHRFATPGQAPRPPSGHRLAPPRRPHRLRCCYCCCFCCCSSERRWAPSPSQPAVGTCRGRWAGRQEDLPLLPPRPSLPPAGRPAGDSRAAKKAPRKKGQMSKTDD